jgi:hypothetical protein
LSAPLAVSDWAMQSIGQTLDRSFRHLSTPRPRFGSGIFRRYRTRMAE